MNTEQDSTQKRKKVLFLITKSNWGGAQRYVYDLATSLPTDRFEVVVAFGGAGKLAQMLAEKGVRTIAMPSLMRDVKLGSDFAALNALIKLFKTERPDIVHLNSSKAGGLGSCAARLAGVPRIIFTAHGWPFWEDRNPLARTLIFFFSYLTVLLSHATICISQYDRRAVARMPFTRRKLHVVHNGIGNVEFLTRADARTALYSPAENEAHADDTWVLSNGELTANKNYFTAIDAIAAYNATALCKIFYSIMSDGEQRAQIESYIAQKNLGSHVKLLGFVPDGRRYYRAFDIFFLPSKKEGVPYVILEAGLAEAPVVASQVGGIPEVIADGESGLLVDPRDTASMTHALDRMASDAEERRRLPAGRQGFAAALKTKVMQDFSLPAMLEQTITLY